MTTWRTIGPFLLAFALWGLFAIPYLATFDYLAGWLWPTPASAQPRCEPADPEITPALPSDTGGEPTDAGRP